MQERIHLDDLAVGDVFTSGTHALDEAQIRTFATDFDPQPFHLDADAARDTLFQGLAASGWHTAAITMRLLVGSLPLAQGVIGAGVEISWPQPTRPGDVLRVTSTILEIVPSRSRPDRAIVVLENITTNQHDDTLQTLKSRIVCFKRGANDAR